MLPLGDGEMPREPNHVADLPSPVSDHSWFSSTRQEVIARVYSPLGFFTLALLIVETFLLCAGIFFDLKEVWKITALGIGVLLFLIVVGSVIFLVIKYPKNLVFSERSHIQEEAMKVYGDNKNPVSAAGLRALPAIEAPEKPVGQLEASEGS